MRNEPERTSPWDGSHGPQQWPPSQPQSYGRDPSPYEPTRPYPGGGGGYGDQGGGYGGQGSYGEYGGYNDPNYQPPSQSPGQYVPPPTPGRTPRWPDPNQPPTPQPPAYPQRSDYTPRQPAYAPPAAERREPARRIERRHAAGHALPHLPIAHVFLVAGLAAMFFAVGQQWGVDAQGNAILVSSFTSPSVQHITGVDTGVAASKLAYGIVIAAAALSFAMILFAS